MQTKNSFHHFLYLIQALSVKARSNTKIFSANIVVRLAVFVRVRLCRIADHRQCSAFTAVRRFLVRIE